MFNGERENRMNKLKIAGLIAIVFSSISLNAFLQAANDIPSDVTPELMAQGKELFNQKEGLKVKFACILCHKQDKAVKKSELQKIGDGLPAVINKYITEKAKGPVLAAESEEMKALMAYIRYEHSK